MYCIVGLGNPEKRYENTRHNIGFDVIDAIAEKYCITVRERGYKALYGKGVIEGRKVILVKPQTYMNLSGESVREVVDYHKIDVEDELIVISDDISLEPGNIRIRKKGSAGGHNGLKNIILHLGTENFQRIRIGVGAKPKEWDLVDHVLGHFSKEERKLADAAIEEAVGAAGIMITDGADKAMNLYNGKHLLRKEKMPDTAGLEDTAKPAERIAAEPVNKIAERDGDKHGSTESASAGIGGV